jgi:nucleotide-binding universal stress UspA family protein
MLLTISISALTSAGSSRRRFLDFFTIHEVFHWEIHVHQQCFEAAEGEDMDIRNVMVPIDFSQPSRMALDYGVDLARVLRARLTLVHVMEPQPVLETATAGEIARIELERREAAFQQLEELVAPEDQDDLDLRIVLKSGNAKMEIAAAVEEQHVDIVVLGTHGRGRLGRFILGSTTEGLLRKLHVPVMTVSRVMFPGSFKRILFATDLSDSSHTAFTLALDMARKLRGDVLALHVMGGPMLAAAEFGTPTELNESALEEVRRRLRTLAIEGKAQGIAVQVSVADGAAATQILRAATENQADLILLAIESKGLIERSLLGTTAERVVREAAIPVLSVPVSLDVQRAKVEQAS